MPPVNPKKISEKQVEIDGLKINYKTIGDGKIPIVLLHGWGVSNNKYLELIRYLSQFSISNFQFLIPDLPGFGKSEEPKKNWNLDDYVEFVDEFIKIVARGQRGFELLKNILEKFDPKKTVYTEEKKKIILIGHSFGGRIAIKYAAKYPEKIDKLVLTGAAGIKHKLTAKQKALFILAKTGKAIFSFKKEVGIPIGSPTSNASKYARKFLYKIAKEKDYYNASPRMKEIMKNVLAEDLTGYLKKIKTPTLLVWGREDKTTPLTDGEIMKSKIENSKLVIIDSANHSLPYQKAEEFGKVVREFVKKE